MFLKDSIINMQNVSAISRVLFFMFDLKKLELIMFKAFFLVAIAVAKQVAIETLVSTVRTVARNAEGKVYDIFKR